LHHAGEADDAAVPPLVLSLFLCVLGYVAVALIQLPNSLNIQASDAEEDDRRISAASLRRP
jgi:hypothetical protein